LRDPFKLKEMNNKLKEEEKDEMQDISNIK
jgi:hypothetical protein